MSIDPRAENCRGFARDAGGRVIGVDLAVDVRSATRYALKRVELIDEISAQGNCVATCTVLDGDGFAIGQPVFLAWPWPNLTEFALPGNMNGQHPITNGYIPPAVGPLALCIRDADGGIISDVVGGLGLPLNRHVSYRAIWQERSGDPDDGGDGDGGEDGSTPADLAALTATVGRCAVALERLVTHLGA